MSQLFLFEDCEIKKPVNVASIPMRSLFRYAGGKTWFVPHLRKWLNSKGSDVKFIEPFVGGGIISLTVAFEALADTILMVEKDEDVSAVWKTILGNDYEWLAERIINFEVNLKNANIIISEKPKSIKDHAFQTIVRNRLQHGGILASGAGLLKNGENGKGLKSRWYPETLKKRILNIQEVKHKIAFREDDAFKIIKENENDDRSVFFIDPPYTIAGRRLYKYFEVDHEELFSQMSKVEGDFIMTYDDTPEIENLAREYAFQVGRVIMKTTHHMTKYELVIGRDLTWLEGC